MGKPKKIQIDIDKLIEKNPAVNVEELARNLELLKELREKGVKIGPNYNLGSPFSRPESHSNKTKSMGSTLRQI